MSDWGFSEQVSAFTAFSLGARSVNKGKIMRSYVNDFGMEFVSGGYFHEQETSYGGSAPAWPSDTIIDGITVVDGV